MTKDMYLVVVAVLITVLLIALATLGYFVLLCLGQGRKIESLECTIIKMQNYIRSRDEKNWSKQSVRQPPMTTQEARNIRRKKK